VSHTRALLADIVGSSRRDGPGNRYTVHFQGCNFDCVACGFPSTKPRFAPGAREVSVADLMADLRAVAPALDGVTATGGEATLQAAFVAAWFHAVQEDTATRRLTRWVVTNGCADAATWDLLLPVTDAVVLDLKALDVATHQLLTGSSNAPVLMSLHRLAAAGQLAEVRVLVVPGHNDGEDSLRDLGDYLAEHAPGVPVRVDGFCSDGTGPDARLIPEPSAEERERYRLWIAESVGHDLVTVA
jgi:pyruvate formate lyase activating enzyme